MAYPRKIVLNYPPGASSKLTPLVDEFTRDGVMFVAVVGNDCSLVEDLIDEIIVRDEDAFILTSYQRAGRIGPQAAFKRLQRIASEFLD
jgi:hypothetical protein